jgi:hypothetical protein
MIAPTGERVKDSRLLHAEMPESAARRVSDLAKTLWEPSRYLWLRGAGNHRQSAPFYCTTAIGAPQNATFCPEGSMTVTWQS